MQRITEVKRVSDRVMSVKLEIEGMVVNIVSDFPNKLAVRWKREKLC